MTVIGESQTWFWVSLSAFLLKRNSVRLDGMGGFLGLKSAKGCFRGQAVMWAWAWGWLARDQACARRKALGGWGFRAAREGLLGVCLQCSLRPGPAAAVQVRRGGLPLGTGCWDSPWGGDGLVLV